MASKLPKWLKDAILSLGLRYCYTCETMKEQGEFYKGCTACKICLNPRLNARKQANPDKHKQYHRKSALLKNYKDLPKDVAERLSKDRWGHCECCGDLKKLVVDHDHATGRMRGLLCHHCNMMLGNALDNPARLELGAAYLRKGSF